jgi:hypothetical protein
MREADASPPNRTLRIIEIRYDFCLALVMLFVQSVLNARKVNGVRILIAFSLVLILAALKPLPPPKVRLQRIHAVNNLANITISWPSSNALFIPHK